MTPARLDPEVVMVRLERITALLSDLETVGEPTAERFEDEPIPRFAAERAGRRRRGAAGRAGPGALGS